MYTMIGAVATALAVLASSLAESFPVVTSLWYLLLFTLLVCGLGIFFAIWGHVILSSPYLTPPAVIDIVEREIQDFRELLEKDTNSVRSCNSKGHQSFLPVVFGRTVDGLLQQLIDLVLRDFLLVWLKEYCHKADVTVAQLKEDVWGAVQKLHQRLSRVDVDRLIAVDMVTKVTTHFEKIRIAHGCSMELNELPVFALSPQLMSSQRELHYLRQISELLIINLMPRSYSLPPISQLLREVLVCKIFQPAINLLTEPDYLNQKILTYLEAQKAVAEMHVKTHDYARTFEDFLKMINSCNDVDALKRIRYNIMSEIMQATTLQNVKRARGIDIEALEKGGANVSRQQWSAARKIKRYIAQLTHAKAMCEQALLSLGWEGAFPLHHTDSAQTLPLNTVLDSVTGRRYLSLFLETVCSQGLVGFWTAVEELRYSHRSNWHQLGAEIFYTYIRSPSAEIKVDKDTWKRMEAFLLGDKGPEVFYEVQQMVFNTIHDKYYSAFVLSEQYKVMAKALLSEEVNEELSDEKSPLSVERQLSSESVSSAESAGAGMHLTDSTYARRKLDQLQERLSNKTQALVALRASLRPGCRALQLLQREVERLAGERRRLEAHLARADAWADNLGRWRANVASAEIIEESKPPQFVIVVHMAEEEEDVGGGEEGAGEGGDKFRPQGITTGWVLLRTLTEFQDLHRKLKPMCPQIKNLDLPTSSFKFLFGKNDKNSVDKAKLQIQNYLEFVLEDDKLNQSEALYTFLSPSSEYFKHTNNPIPKKARFSFSTLFKSNEANLRSCQERDQSVREGTDEEEISLSLDAEGEGEARNSSGKGSLWSGQEDGKDAIAEPLYSLLGEVFDMRGVFKWLRRTLISFVQITYGRTINRQIRDTISWLFSEQMLHYYISVGIKAWWPGGALCKPVLNRGRQEKEETRARAREQFIGNVPEVLASLVGAQTAQRGAHKVFDTFQNAPQNKQLFYDLLELLFVEVFPELKRHL